MIQCPSCLEMREPAEVSSGDLVPPSVTAVIHQQHPHWSPEQAVCRTCVNAGKAGRLQAMLEAEMGPLTPLEKDVLASIRDDTVLSLNSDPVLAQPLNGAERLAVAVTAIVGSWRFSSAIVLFLALWVGINVVWRPFQPYPIVILAVISAVLGSLAAIQGPIILMAQRRQQKHDRLRAENDYRVNLKAELEIEYLDEKISYLLAGQKQLLTEIKAKAGQEQL